MNWQRIKLQGEGEVAATTAELVEQKQAILARFVVRLRRVAAHSLAKDLETLKVYADGAFEVHGTDSGTRLVQKVPKQEELESLGARIRPLLLQNDDAHYTKGIGALDYLVRQASGLKRPDILSALCKGLKNEWRSLEESTKHDDDPIVRVFDPSDQRTHVHSWRELAWAWVYIDLVHEDADRVANSGKFGIRQRYWGGMMLMARAARNAVAHLDLIRQFVDNQVIELPAFAFEEEVEVSPEDFVREVKVHAAPVGTALPEQFEAPGPEWSDIESVVADSGDDERV